MEIGEPVLPHGRVRRYDENPKYLNRRKLYKHQRFNEETELTEETEESDETDRLTEPPVLSESALAYQQYLPKRRLGAGCAIAVSETLTKDVQAPATPTPALTLSSQPVEKRVRLTTDIRKPLHDRLRHYRIRVDKTNMQIIEEWIERYCPE